MEGFDRHCDGNERRKLHDRDEGGGSVGFGFRRCDGLSGDLVGGRAAGAVVALGSEGGEAHGTVAFGGGRVPTGVFFRGAASGGVVAACA